MVEQSVEVGRCGLQACRLAAFRTPFGLSKNLRGLRDHPSLRSSNLVYLIHPSTNQTGGCSHT